MARIDIRIDSVLIDGAATPDPHTFCRELADTLAEFARRHRGAYSPGAVAHLQAAQLDTTPAAGAVVAQRVWDAVVTDRTDRLPAPPSLAGPPAAPSAATPHGAGS